MVLIKTFAYISTTTRTSSSLYSLQNVSICFNIQKYNDSNSPATHMSNVCLMFHADLCLYFRDNNFIKDFPQLADGLMVIPLPVEEQCRGVLSEPLPNLQLLSGESSFITSSEGSAL